MTGAVTGSALSGSPSNATSPRTKRLFAAAASPALGYTLGIGTVTGPGTWTRVTAVTETSSSISVTVNSLRAPLPGTGDDILELRVTLSGPIGGRTVIDANGLPVPRSGG